MKQIPATEAQIQATICDFLTLAGIPFTVTDAAHVTINGVTRGRAKIRRGWPDVTACLPPDGTLLAIEVKSAKGKLRLDQEAVLAQLEAAGAVVVVARSLEEVVNEIKSRLNWSGQPYPTAIQRAIDGIQSSTSPR